MTARAQDRGAPRAWGSARGLLVALLAGGASVLSFSPFGIFPLAVLSLAVLGGLAARQTRARGGFALGFAWGLGAFLAGVSWLYVALNRYGGMPMPLAALAILLFCTYLALFPAAVGALFVRLGGRGASPAACGLRGPARGTGRVCSRSQQPCSAPEGPSACSEGTA